MKFTSMELTDFVSQLNEIAFGYRFDVRCALGVRDARYHAMVNNHVRIRNSRNLTYHRSHRG